MKLTEILQGKIKFNELNERESKIVKFLKRIKLIIKKIV